MSDMDDYDKLLQGSWDDIPEDVKLPTGDWLVEGKNIAIFKPREAGKQLRVAAFLTAIEPVDVDESRLGELPEDFDPSDSEIAYQWFVGKRSDWRRVKAGLEAVFGLELTGEIVTEDGKINPEVNRAFKGQRAVAHVTKELVENREGKMEPRNNVTRVSAYEG